MRRLLSVSLAATLCAAIAPSQCLFSSVTTQPFGTSCNAASTGLCLVAQFPTWLEASLDTQACELDVAIVAFSGCGASVPLRALVVGTQQIQVPIPEFGGDCFLQVAPVILAATTGPVLTLALPPNVATLSFEMQGYAMSIPISGPAISTLSRGYSVSLQ